MMRNVLAKMLGRHHGYTIELDYPLVSRPRYTREAPHRQLYGIIDRNCAGYLTILQDMRRFSANFAEIGINPAPAAAEPHWDNDWFPLLDAMALYYFLVVHNPATYIEVGSGNSTKFARKAIADHGLRTRIVSIDPFPRADIDAICDQVVRQRLEEVDISLFAGLCADDVVFIDNSHRMFMNSDATVAFLDVLPSLPQGVLVQFHDICLPYDYPADWSHRYYSEQYGLACYLLAGGGGLETIFPCKFIIYHEQLSLAVADVCQASDLSALPRNGCSYWLRRG